MLCQLLEGGLSSLLWGLPVLMIRQLASPRARDPGGSNREEAAMSPSSGFGSHTLLCLPYPNGYTSQPYPVWEETATEHEYRKAKIMGAKWMAEKEVV